MCRCVQHNVQQGVQEGVKVGVLNASRNPARAPMYLSSQAKRNPYSINEKVTRKAGRAKKRASEMMGAQRQRDWLSLDGAYGLPTEKLIQIQNS